MRILWMLGYKVEHVKLALTLAAALCLVTLTMVNLYIFRKYPDPRRTVIDINEPLWEQDIDFHVANIRNDTGTLNGCYLVPNIIHFLHFGNSRFTFVEMICVLAAFKNQNPDKIIFHKNHNSTFTGPYWEVLSQLKPLKEITEFNYIDEPTEIFGQPIKPHMRKYHGSDITRIRILMKFGGIFLDNDAYIIRSLNDFRRFEMTLNWDEGQFLGTQVLLAHRNARFLKLWLESYRNAYRGDLWYYNAGERPTKEILWNQPQLIHRVKVQFGVDTNFIGHIFQQEWSGWRKMYAMHLLIHHQYLLSNLTKEATFPVEFNERNIKYYPITFREMAYDVYDIGNISWPKLKS